MEQHEARTDGAATIIIKRSMLASYLHDIRQLENWVPLKAVTEDSTHVTIVKRGSDIPLLHIEIDDTDNEGVEDG